MMFFILGAQNDCTEIIDKKTNVPRLNFFNGEAVGYIGELHPQLCADLSLPSPTIICEISMDFLNQKKSTLSTKS